jgi:WD40 repeat protein
VNNWQSELQLEWQSQLDDLVTALACAPNGRGWAASSAAGEVVWNPGLLDLVELRAADGQSIDNLAFSADSRWLAAGGQAGQLLVWNCEDPLQPPQFVREINFNQWIEHLSWHPVDSYLTISYGSQLKILDVPTFEQVHTWEVRDGAAPVDHEPSIFDLAWHPSGAYLATAGYKGVQIWTNLSQNAPLQQLWTDTASIKTAWAGNGRYLAAGNFDRTITIVDWQNPADRWILSGCPGKIRQIVWIDGSTTPCLAVASGMAIILWHLSSETMTWEGKFLEGHQGNVATLITDPDLPFLASGSADGYICLWSSQGEIHQIITDGVSQFTTLAWNPDHQYLVTGSQIGSIGVWMMPA